MLVAIARTIAAALIAAGALVALMGWAADPRDVAQALGGLGAMLSALVLLMLAGMLEAGQQMVAQARLARGEALAPVARPDEAERLRLMRAHGATLGEQVGVELAGARAEGRPISEDEAVRRARRGLTDGML